MWYNNNPNFDLNVNLSDLIKSRKEDDYYSEFFAEVFSNSQSSTPNDLGEAMKQWLKLKGF